MRWNIGNIETFKMVSYTKLKEIIIIRFSKKIKAILKNHGKYLKMLLTIKNNLPHVQDSDMALVLLQSKRQYQMILTTSL